MTAEVAVLERIICGTPPMVTDWRQPRFTPEIVIRLPAGPLDGLNDETDRLG
jgi:hypothetical protein